MWSFYHAQPPPAPHSVNRTLFLFQLAIAVSLAAASVGLATFYREGEVAWQPILQASFIVLLGCVPPLWFSALIKQGPAQVLLVVGWRFGSLLPAILIFRKLEGLERNCFMYAMMACYFVGLSLESWHFIREAQKSQESDGSSDSLG